MNLAPGGWRYALPPLLAAPFALIFSVTAGVLALALGLGTLAFFRDPDRSPPPRGVVSPADGTVSVLRTEGDGRVRLGIFMNVWNVHVARAPFAGTVADVEHSPGAHRPAFSKDSDRNEKVHVRLARDAESALEADGAGAPGTAADEPANAGESPDYEVTLVAGAFARRIYPYVEAGDDLERGERIGHIAFGSRVDVVFPPATDREDVAVAVGDRVTAGETIVLETGADGDGVFDVGEPGPLVLEDESDDETGRSDERPGPGPGGDDAWT